MSQGNNIKVLARFRPQNAREIKEGGEEIVEITDNTTVNLKFEDIKGAFTFDYSFGKETSQREFFEFAIKPTLDDVFNGYNGTVFAYGQTGSGKTFTMMGGDIEDENLKGVIPRIVEGIFTHIMDSPPTFEYMVEVSYMEIYMERIRDLLEQKPGQSTNLQVHENKNQGVYVKGLSSIFVASVGEVYELMKQGAKNRMVAYTNMNAESSRSHSIFQITIHQKNTTDGKTKTGRLSLVDLAGSEKVGKTGASGQTLEEAKMINKSLSALGMVINALTDGKSTHIPYRDSKLTRILQESLGGNSRTTLVINCSPSSFNAEETMSTLRFGTRAKSIKNKAKVNQDLSPAELKNLLKKSNNRVIKFQVYINALEGEVKTWRSGETVDPENYVTWEKICGSEEKPPAAPAGAAQRSSTGGRQSALSRASVSNGSPYPPDASSTGTPSSSRVASPTPPSGVTESIMAELTSTRPVTPATAMGDDEREGFLRRENELADQLSERERELAEQTKNVEYLKEELDVLKKGNSEFTQTNAKLTSESNQLRIDYEKLQFDHQEAKITIESINETNNEIKKELERVRSELESLKLSSRDDGVTSSKEKDREQIKIQRMAAMIQGMEGARGLSQQESGMSNLLHALVDAGGDSDKQIQVIAELRKKVDEQEATVQTYKQLTMELQSSNAHLLQKRDEVELQYTKLLEEYEEMLEKSIAAEERSERENETISGFKKMLEQHYTTKINEQSEELNKIRDDVRKKAEEISALNSTISLVRNEKNELEAKNKKLQSEVDSKPTGDTSLHQSLPEGQTAAEYIAIKEREMQQMRRDMAQRILEYDTMRKSLMRDVQNRCEKIIELEMALDESREQVGQLTRRVNNPAQPQRMALLEKNIAQLTMMQKELVVQNTDLKKELSLSERKLTARTDRIQTLEHRLESIGKERDQIMQKYNELMQQRNLEKSMAGAGHYGGHNAGNSYNMNYQQNFAYARVAKPLRGGGGIRNSGMVAAGGAPNINTNNVGNVDSMAEKIASPPPNNKRNSWMLWKNS
ncbi:hypothetical protein H4219_000546 [Mycoemilia scoparia]|uniref:Kinesin motor domain-containing protein n=1 Tax=Mycoemilia scoparia TaxID=417184 RepID=A0A9W8AAE0_9FUNG|nr:hypothetical protein H4219_000546 [Mycoemilia scoparia]